MNQPTLSFVLIFLFFSLMFLSNSYKLWFKTDTYYEDVRNSLIKTPAPFKEFFLRRLDNRKRWESGQKIYSLIGIAAVVAMDILVVIAYLK